MYPLEFYWSQSSLTHTSDYGLLYDYILVVFVGIYNHSGNFHVVSGITKEKQNVISYKNAMQHNIFLITDIAILKLTYVFYKVGDAFRFLKLLCFSSIQKYSGCVVASYFVC